MATRVREALWADSATSRYADRIAIGTRTDSDDLIEVAQRATGVVEVIDELEVAGV